MPEDSCVFSFFEPGDAFRVFPSPSLRLPSTSSECHLLHREVHLPFSFPFFTVRRTLAVEAPDVLWFRRPSVSTRSSVLFIWTVCPESLPPLASVILRLCTSSGCVAFFFFFPRIGSDLTLFSLQLTASVMSMRVYLSLRCPRSLPQDGGRLSSSPLASSPLRSIRKAVFLLPHLVQESKQFPRPFFDPKRHRPLEKILLMWAASESLSGARSFFPLAGFQNLVLIFLEVGISPTCARFFSLSPLLVRN